MSGVPGCGVTNNGGYLYGFPRSSSTLGEDGARAAAEACAASRGANYVAVKTTCNISDGFPAQVRQPCYRVQRIRSAGEPTVFQKIGRFFTNLFN